MFLFKLFVFYHIIRILSNYLFVKKYVLSLFLYHYLIFFNLFSFYHIFSSFAFCFYNSLTLALCEYNGRFYGGGVGELVPNEFKSLAIPYKKVAKEHLQQLDNMFRSETPFSDIIDYVDTVVLGSLSDNEIKLLQNVRNRYLTRRLKLYERDEHDGQYE